MQRQTPLLVPLTLVARPSAALGVSPGDPGSVGRTAQLPSLVAQGALPARADRQYDAAGRQEPRSRGPGRWRSTITAASQ